MDNVVSARIYIGTGLSEPGNARAPGKYGNHYPVIDPVDVQAQVSSIVSRKHAGFTVYQGRGSWEGRGEPSLVVELWEPAAEAASFRAKVEATARALVTALDQLSVAVVMTGEDGRQIVKYLNLPEQQQVHAHRYRQRA